MNIEQFLNGLRFLPTFDIFVIDHNNLKAVLEFFDKFMKSLVHNFSFPLEIFINIIQFVPLFQCLILRVSLHINQKMLTITNKLHILEILTMLFHERNGLEMINDRRLYL